MGCNLLLFATMTKTKTVRVLIEHGAHVNAKDESHSTALHLASSKGSYGAVRLLIQHGANVTAKDRNNRTPLHLALSWVCHTTATQLIEHRLIEIETTTGRQPQWGEH